MQKIMKNNLTNDKEKNMQVQSLVKLQKTTILEMTYQRMATPAIYT
jgi:hypothetical protein